ncbi:MAG: tRNA (adenosine(37)-N6)-dimethylallyltransferase MiaA [Propionibacteriaceae bacterium]|nr:tRNA (adenosine(37)-N6)-dimethylallyltransferase MiaA [Propionibacteriaceae bacterium]
MHNDLPVVVLAGSTASGKSTLAIELARELHTQGRDAEIINADSMCVYRGMDIGTAKPTRELRGLVTHHLIDIMDLHETASVAEFRQLARRTIAVCREAQILPIVVGGSALYLHGIVDDVDFPPTNDEVRARLTAEMATHGVEYMYSRLQGLDSQAAQDINPANQRRIIRALESIELTGHFQATLPAWTFALDNVRIIGLDIDRDLMDARIEARVKDMWDQGFVDEVRSLLDQGLREAPTASKAIGYRQIMAYLDHEISENEAQELTIMKTRQFARKQIAWWKRDSRIHWVRHSTPADQLLAVVDSLGQ